jgi:RNA-directed DNA polymerase
MAGLSEVSRGHSTTKWEGPNNRRFSKSLKDTKKYKESRQLPKGGYLHKDRVEPQSSAGAPSISSMSQSKENNVNEYNGRLLEKILEPANLNLAYKKVRANRGSSGVDGMTVEDLLEFLKQNGQKIRQQVLKGTYKPSPVQRVEIPKPDGGSRMLGIPTVLDRVIQQAIAQILTPLFESKFSEHSYGFRPGRSAKQAVIKCKEYIEAGYTWTVDIDLANYFDTVNHDRLIRRLSQTVKDARVISLVRKYLVSGVMINGVITETQKGTPQGGNLSPLLANIVLDELDTELGRRGLCFVRYADDSAPRRRRAAKVVLRHV